MIVNQHRLIARPIYLLVSLLLLSSCVASYKASLSEVKSVIPAKEATQCGDNLSAAIAESIKKEVKPAHANATATQYLVAIDAGVGTVGSILSAAFKPQDTKNGITVGTAILTGLTTFVTGILLVGQSDAKTGGAAGTAIIDNWDKADKSTDAAATVALLQLRHDARDFQLSNPQFDFDIPAAICQ